VQVTLAAGTGPFEVAGLNAQVTVRTTVGDGCSTVMTALMNDMSVMISVHEELGQSGAPGIGVVGEFVVTLNGVLPFLSSLAGIDTLPVTVTGAGFCPEPGSLERVAARVSACTRGVRDRRDVDEYVPEPEPRKFTGRCKG